ncbi:conjugative transposon TraN protein [Flavobacterium nitrogenifigens]|uniref:Conjugative transposon TraN protein n=2 Tax=Flavobacterium TaxID=237 RepID=A0A7W7J289_9FLAO|nr:MULTISPECIES: conjugative transposon protein TraN [Flavobacterium]MBB4804553.1 conjugative transposon TraN protein [Flavobacterium nitrogenifigens]MBB6389512.1 conjugative transposon TraN protein [Flavobacterium notoginsengisoli]
MKKILRIIFAMLLLNAAPFLGQPVSRNEDPSTDIKSLEISFYKTTSIVFPYAIKSMDKGSGDILVQKAKGVENILLVKAGKKGFVQTNLTVVTADSRFYVFVLNYNDDCPDLNIAIDNRTAANHGAAFPAEIENQQKIEQFAGLALSKKKKLDGLKRSKFEMKLTVSGIFIHDDIMYFRLAVENASKINYEIDQLRFFIRDQKKSRRTASQEIEIMPVFALNELKTVADKSEAAAVYALPKFTIPEQRCLTIQLIENNGGRHLEVDIKGSFAGKIFPL